MGSSREVRLQNANSSEINQARYIVANTFYNSTNREFVLEQTSGKQTFDDFIGHDETVVQSNKTFITMTKNLIKLIE